MFVLVLSLGVFFAINGLITEHEEKQNEESLLDNSAGRSHQEKGLDSSLMGK